MTRTRTTKYEDVDDYEDEPEDHVLVQARLRSRFDLLEIDVELASWYHFDAHASRETFASPIGSLGLELFVSDG